MTPLGIRRSYFQVAAAALYLSGLITVANSFLNGIVSVTVVFRVINIPVVAWILTGLYSIASYYLKGSGKDKKALLFQAVVLGFVTHQYLLFVRLFDMIFSTPIGRIFIGYIIAVFAVATFLTAVWGLRIIRNVTHQIPARFSQIYFFPVVLMPFWPVAYFIFRRAYGLEAVTLLSIVCAVAVFKTRIYEAFSAYARRVYTDRIKVLIAVAVISCMFCFSFAANVIVKTEFATPKVDYVTASDDGPTYDEHGRLLAADFSALFRDGIITPGLFEPGYGVFLGFIYRIFSRNFFVVGFIQAIMLATVMLLCFSIAQQFFDFRTALIGACLIALNQSLIFIFGTLNAEVTYILFIYLSLWMLARGYRNDARNPLPVFFFSGLVFGLAVISRGVILLFPLFIFIWMIGKSVSRKKRPAEAFKHFGIFMAGLAIVLIGMCSINYLNVHRFILTGKADAYLRASSAALEDYHFDPNISPGNTLFLKRGFDFSRPSELMKKIMTRPLYFAETYLEVVPTRIKNFFFWPEHGYFDPVMLYQDSNPFKETLVFYAIVLFFAGLIVSIRRFTVDKFLILSLILYYSMLHATIGFVETVRYRIPVVPCIVIITSYGISWLLTNVLKAQNGVSEHGIKNDG